MNDKNRTAAFVGSYFVRLVECLPEASVELRLSSDRVIGIKLVVTDGSGQRHGLNRMIDTPLMAEAIFDAGEAGIHAASKDAKMLNRGLR